MKIPGPSPCAVVEVDDGVEADKDSGGEPLALLFPKMPSREFHRFRERGP